MDNDMLTELRKIRELLEKPPPPPPVHGLLQEFKAFLKQYGVLGLAVAFILGVYLGALVKALVGDLILPIIGLVMPGTDLTNLKPIFSGQTFAIGDFLNAVITFLIVALVIFLIVKIAKRYKID
jgi:large conductance mechanosensitive channel